MPHYELECRKCIIQDVKLGFSPFEEAFLPIIDYAPVELSITFVDLANYVPVCKHQATGSQPSEKSSSFSDKSQLIFQLDNFEDYQKLCHLAHNILKEREPESFPGLQVNNQFIQRTYLHFRTIAEVLKPDFAHPPIDFVIDLTEKLSENTSNPSQSHDENEREASGQVYNVTLSLDNPKEYRDLYNIGLRLLKESDPTKFPGHEVTLIFVKQKSPFANILGAIGNKEGTQFVIPNFHIDNDIISEMTVDPFTQKQTEVVIQSFGCF